MSAGHPVNGTVCPWAEDGHLIHDNVCYNAKVCVDCCAKAGGCCYDPVVDGPRPTAP